MISTNGAGGSTAAARARDLPGGDWKDLLDRAALIPHSPRLIVASRLPEDRLWAEVLNLGGYDVLAKPFLDEEVIRVLELAYLDWQRAAEQRPLAWAGAGSRSAG